MLESNKDITVYYNLKHLQWSLATSTDKNKTFTDKSAVFANGYLLNSQGLNYTEKQLSSTTCKKSLHTYSKPYCPTTKSKRT